MTAKVIANALADTVEYFRMVPEVSEQAAILAINQVVSRDGLNVIKSDMRSQIDFPKGYLESGRLKVTRKASKGSLEAVITGRDRATSLARFAQGQTPANTRGRGVRVRVAPGVTRKLPKAFLVNLKNGNTGLAVRLSPGQQLKNSQAAVKLADGVYLLYGPSVDQVLDGVVDDRAGDLLDMISRQFFRQFARLSRG